MMEFYEQRLHIARKAHKCEMCGGTIAPGEQYSYEIGKFDGEFFARKLHAACFGILYEFYEEVDTEFTWDDIRDYWCETYCPQCAHYWPECEPDEMCAPPWDRCPRRDAIGHCTGCDPCYELTRVYWCDKFINKNQQNENE